MIFDYISDLHLEFIFNLTKGEPNQKQVKVWFDSVFQSKQSDILIIAGDVSEYVSVAIGILGTIQELYDYKTIFYVFGNHDMWLSTRNLQDKFKNDSYLKMKSAKRLCDMYNDSHERKIYLLDGDVHEIEGIKIGGCMGWYDTTYYYTNNHLYSSPNVYDVWQRTMNDFRYMHPRTGDYTLWTKTENEKLYNIFKKAPDIVVTHVCPIPFDTVTEKQFKGNLNNTFYMFNGLDLIYDYKPKVWVYGHMHSSNSLEVDHTLVIRNAHGYPNESYMVQVKSFEI